MGFRKSKDPLVVGWKGKCAIVTRRPPARDFIELYEPPSPPTKGAIAQSSNKIITSKLKRQRKEELTKTR